MKIWLSTALGLGLLTGANLESRAFQSPEQRPLPNYDKRKESTVAAAALANPQQAAAVSQLDSRLNGLRLSRHAQLGTPRFLSARRGFLTGSGGVGKGLSQSSVDAVAANDPHRIVKAFVNEHSPLFTHDSTLLDDATVKVDGVTAHNGLRTVIWQQQLDQVPVYGGLFVSHLTKKQELVSISDRFVPNLTQVSEEIVGREELVAAPPVSVTAAIRFAASNLGEILEEASLSSLTAAEGSQKKQSFTSSHLRGEAYAQLVWLPVNGSLELCWQVVLTAKARPEMYLTLVSATTGEIMVRRCVTEYLTNATYRVYTSDSPSPFSPGHSAPSAVQPPLTNRALVTLSALNTNASPSGWINDGGNETLGNNVDAHLDRNDDNAPDLPRPQGNPNRVFDFQLELTQAPTAYGNAAVVNLFYWNNFAHDKLYELGFTEVFGNFQQDNFGRGGNGQDRVSADGQDGGGVNNANFSTPPDGIPGRMQMYIFNGPSPDRDGDLDAEIMLHEYGHGVSNRLLGGGEGIYELQPAGMGEGWSDFYGLALLSEPGDDPRAAYAVGGYATYNFYGLQQNYYFGIRRYPYSTDMSKNPLTLKDIDPVQADAHAGVPINPVFGGAPADEVHAMGEVWCIALWEARANLVEKYGPTLGNQTMLRLVTDGLKLSPPNATFLEARDGILQADEILSGGDNLAELWVAFAKRGMGFSASVPTADTTIGVQEAYDVPDYVNPGPPDGILEVVITPSSGTAIFGGETNAIFVRVTDGIAVTNATIATSLSTGGTLTFRNNGVAPDLTANNAVYSANYIAPNVITNVTLTLVITAPGKDPSTNQVVYAIVPLPANDNFTNATKVIANGGSFITNNKRATTESGEPVHSGVASAAASLWWQFTPTNNATVLIDTAGSAADTIVAVYTNTTLATLQPVISSDDVGSRKQSFVLLNGKPGVPYRIAIASHDTNSTGTIRLAITPGGVPDTNAPSVVITSPLSGLTLTTNRIEMTGTAIDPDPSPSGLQEIQFRVTSSSQGGGQNWGGGSSLATYSLISTNWARAIGLFEGLNTIEVTVRDVAGNQSAPVSIEATYRPLDPPNDFFVNAITLAGTTDTNTVNTLNATKEVGEPNHADNPGGKSAWWKFQPPFDGVLSLTTSNSTFDTLLAVYSGSTVTGLTAVAFNDDAAPGVPGGVSALTVTVRSNTLYRIAVDGFDGVSGVVFLKHSLTPATLYHLTINTSTGGSVSPGSQDVVSNATVVVTATPNSAYQFDKWEGDIVSLANPLTLQIREDQSITARFRPVAYSDGFESGDFTGLGWTTGGDQPWIVQTNSVSGGVYAARSGAIGDGQTSSLSLGGDYRAGVGSFDLRVSSESGWDFLRFYVDGNLQQQWSGEMGWLTFSFPLTAGAHTLEWRYVKDSQLGVGLDAAFIDSLTLPVLVPVDASTPAQLTAHVQTDGMVYLDLTGQANQLYLVQASTNLQNWVTISTNVLTGGFAQVLDSESLAHSARFYRAVSPAP